MLMHLSISPHLHHPITPPFSLSLSSSHLSSLSFPSSPFPPLLPLRYNHRYLHRYHPPRALFESFQPVIEATSVLTAIIIVHEGGHFLAATLQGIHVSKFAIGFGPVLARFVYPKDGVEYSLRAFPLGGFVAFPDADDPDCGIPANDPDLLRNRPIVDRIVVVSAGVVANITFAFFLIFTQSLTTGLPVQEPLPGVLVPDVRPGSAGARSGLLAGDIVLSSPSVSDLVNVIKSNPEKSLNVKVKRNGFSDPLDLKITPDLSQDGTGRIGVQLSPNFRVTRLKASNLAEATSLASKEFVLLIAAVFEGLKQTFLNFSQSAEKVSGPVAIIAVGAEVAKSSVEGLFQFAAIINLNLAAINLLPLPALDGGTLALLLVEAARGGRRIPREVEQSITSSGVLLVVMLGLFLIVRDTLNLDFIREML
ncbi:Membrane metalloprotease ARASP [Carex littledalei]|uniref:Membrane metalloprotease ARASP n=1 Tax=Carex littledalei TaxID=544730 RepID=A0A833QLS6_9POAL|nr:Membrane metalloprotease ARASP [Carex littledalei]